MKDEGFVNFTIPDGLDLSELSEGEEKEVLAKIKLKKDGKAAIVSIEGFALGKEPKEEIEDEDSDDEEEESYAATMMSRAGIA